MPGDAADRRSAAHAKRPKRSSAGRSSTTPRSRWPAGSSTATARSATARTPPKPSTGCWRGSRPATTSSASRSCGDKRVDELLERLGRAGSTFVATTLQQPARAAREGARRARRSALLGGRTRSPIRARRSRARAPSGAPSSSPAPSICSRTSTRERKTAHVDESWRTDHRLRVRGRRRAVDRGDRVRSRLHRRSTSPITG